MPRRGSRRQGEEDIAERDVNLLPPSIIIRPKEKTEDMSVLQYVDYFKKIMKVNKWSDEESGDIFAALLGPTDQSTMGLSWNSFSDLEKQLKEKQLPMREANLAQLMRFEIKEGETIQQLRDRGLHLISLVYPDFSEDMKSKLARDFIVYALPDDLKKQVLGGRPTTLEETVSVAAACFEMSNGVGIVSAVETKNLECWFCHERGHLQRLCPKKKKWKKSKGNGGQLCLLGESQLMPSSPQTTMEDSS
jgi:hypothetical protein